MDHTELAEWNRRWATERLADLLNAAEQAVIAGDITATARAIGGAQYCAAVLSSDEQAVPA